MGLSDQQFGRLTFRQLDALLGRIEHRERRWDARFAMVDCLIANQWRDAKDRLSPEDFMPKVRVESKRQTPEQMRDFIVAFRAARARQRAKGKADA